MKFRKKPVVVEARQWTGKNADEIIVFMWGDYQFGDVVPGKPITIHTLEGDHQADIGDWIIKGVKGELYLCKPDIFAQTYEEVV